MLSISDYSAEAEAKIRSISYPGGRLAPLYAPVEYAMQAGGKRLRPVLLLMACDAFGGDRQSALQAAAGIEMYHNFTLLHDDVMDCSDTRRGRPTVQARFGVNAAILSGDTMLTLASRLVEDVDAECRGRVADAFNTMALRVYEGQSLDMTFETEENVTSDDYVDMVRLKTGALLGCAAQIGAYIAGVGEKEASAMLEFGEQLGIAFQIQDDLLDCFGDPATFGKPIGGDILNNKKTWLYLKVLERGGSDADTFRAAMSLPPSEMKIKAVKRLYSQFGMEDACRKAVADYSARAMTAIRSAGLGQEGREAFHKLSDKLVGRRK